MRLLVMLIVGLSRYVLHVVRLVFVSALVATTVCALVLISPALVCLWVAPIAWRGITGLWQRLQRSRASRERDTSAPSGTGQSAMATVVLPLHNGETLFVGGTALPPVAMSNGLIVLDGKVGYGQRPLTPRQAVVTNEMAAGYIAEDGTLHIP